MGRRGAIGIGGAHRAPFRRVGGGRGRHAGRVGGNAFGSGAASGGGVGGFSFAVAGIQAQERSGEQGQGEAVHTRDYKKKRVIS
ncbi:MAG: hypothetical protein EOO37_02580 [Cytophagaceae bacterium]|nr:MAG: hypothetical protein EOO37_02580 [Cytophagaceae bacterium]